MTAVCIFYLITYLYNIGSSLFKIQWKPTNKVAQEYNVHDVIKECSLSQQCYNKLTKAVDRVLIKATVIL